MNQKILFIGGWTRNNNSYKKLWQTAPEDYDLLFLPCGDVTDRKDHGSNADFIKKYLADNNIDRCIIAGHSLGGGLGIEFAAENPETIEKLILIDSSGIRSEQRFHEKLQSAARNQMIHFKHKAKENITTFARILTKPITNFKSMKLAYSDDIKPKMKLVASETVILWGEKDHMFPPSQAGQIHELIPNSKLIILPEMDHDWIIHTPELFWNNI